MTTYTTVQGDTWDLVSYKCYGSSRYMDKLLIVNNTYIRYFFLPSGITLNIPEIYAQAVQSLPPWKRAKG